MKKGIAYSSYFHIEQIDQTSKFNSEKYFIVIISWTLDNNYGTHTIYKLIHLFI